MSRAIVLVIAFMHTAGPCFGQTLHKADSIEGHRQRVKAQRTQRSRNVLSWKALEAWRSVKKLTFLDNMPDFPHTWDECLNPKELSNNSIGYLDRWGFRVFEVSGPGDVLLAFGSKYDPSLVWLSGYPTNELVDEDVVHLVGLVRVMGTKTYDTVDGGKSTVRVIRLFTKKELKKIEAEEEAQRLESEAAAEAALYRTWTDATGKHKVIAKFLEYKSGKVQIQRKDEKTVELSFTKLSNDDQKWVREELKKRAKQRIEEQKAASRQPR